MELRFIRPYWKCADNVEALCTTRYGGLSSHPYKSFNLGLHVGDDVNCVEGNRSLLKNAAGCENLVFVNQIHGTGVKVVTSCHSEPVVDADALVTDVPGVALAIMTADCLPVLLAHSGGKVIGNAHAGWRGLCAGVLENTLQHMNCNPEDITAYLGPCIDVKSFEVGAEVREQFLAKDSECGNCFIPGSREGKYFANLPFLARRTLVMAGVPSSAIFGGFWSTFRQDWLFYSYRRDGGKTGRMASLVWLKK